MNQENNKMRFKVMLLSGFLLLIIACQKNEIDSVTKSNIDSITFEGIHTVNVEVNIFDLSDDVHPDYGVCYSSVNQLPTISDSKVSKGILEGIKKEIITIQDLQPGIKTYIRAFVMNGSDPQYSFNVKDTTLPQLPATTTLDATNITTNSATSGGKVTEDGGGTVTSRGVCWSINHNPTIAGSHTSAGNGLGSFTIELTELSQSTIYFVRAYATNSAGTAYGNEVSFTTLVVCGDIVSYEGQNYNTILIGAQCWFKENLNVGTRINGTISQTNNGTIEKYCYNNSETYCNTYGGLYQWNEMMQYSTNEGIEGICPLGWHLPTEEQWTTLTTYLGSAAGGKMKETGTIHWLSPNTGATNSSGFTALPAGARNSNGIIDMLGYNAFIWSSTMYNSSESIYRHIDNTSSNVSPGFDNIESWGFSVRCIKD